MKKFIATAIGALFLFSACNLVHHRISGNGHIKTENRSVSSFRNVDISGNFEVHVSQDSATSVRVEADENLMQYIHISNEGETLFIEPEGGANLHGTNAIKVFISSPAYKDLVASGACEIISTDTVKANQINLQLTGASEADMYLDAPKIKTELTGASSLKLKGKTRDFSVEGSGASKIRCGDLLAENVTVEISGAGNAEVYASVNLNAQVSGAGDIKYRGNAAVTKDINGAGSVTKIN
jgi:hypothetical protein